MRSGGLSARPILPIVIERVGKQPPQVGPAALLGGGPPADLDVADELEKHL